MIKYELFFIFFLPLLHYGYFEKENVCHADRKSEHCEPTAAEKYVRKRYILYDVNPGEGFNLRRDVYMRIATTVKKLNEEATSYKWLLVLPPWGPLYHWKSKDVGYQAQIKWSKFFDVPSLKRYVPVVEFEEFLNEHGPEIDVVYNLQHYEEGWEDNKFEEKVDLRKCIDPPPYEKTGNNEYIGWFWGYEDVIARDFHCLSMQGYSSTLKKFVLSLDVKVIMFDRAEVILHDTFGDAEYWKVRKSMVFSKELTTIGDSFRKEILNSTDELDKTEKRTYNLHVKQRSAVGGPYVGVHLRRRDFIQSRSNDVPDIKHAATQVLKQMKKLYIQSVFVATDASISEFTEFQKYIPSAVRYVPDHQEHKKILDGGVAIVDQWICSHSRYFIGTYESTFSFRIQEEREILGFPIKMTFNRLCGSNQTACSQPAKWTIVHT